MDFAEMYCTVDDFCQSLLSFCKSHLLEGPDHKRIREGQLSLSEQVTIMLNFHTSGFRTFKQYYLFLQNFHRKDFPNLVCYHRFVELMPSLVIPIGIFMATLYGAKTKIYFVDSTKIEVCKMKRQSRNKVFSCFAKIGKSSMGWFFGFKLHLIINEIGEIMAVSITAGNVDDRKPVANMAKGLVGKLFGDKGYIGKNLFAQLMEDGLKLVTSVKSNMKNKLIEIEEKILLRKRSVIETVNDHLKNVCQIEHSRHRSKINFLVNLLSGLVSYMLLPAKPHINFNNSKQSALIQCLR